MKVNHFKHNEIKILVENDINVLLEGERGSGKSTMIKKVADELELDLYTISMTKQTTLNALIGFISINGNYIPSLLRTAVEKGGIMLLDELDAADPNVILCLNTLENGYLACPDGNINKHKNFRLCATANPSTEHHIYTGRAKLDGATLDRFERVQINRDSNLELILTDHETTREINDMRKVLSNNNLSKTLSMRDTIRLHKRKSLGLAKDYYKVLLEDESIFPEYEKLVLKNKPEVIKPQVECNTINELWDTIKKEAKISNNNSSKHIKSIAKNWVDHGTAPQGYQIINLGASADDPFNTYIKIITPEGLDYKINTKDIK